MTPSQEDELATQLYELSKSQKSREVGTVVFSLGELVEFVQAREKHIYHNGYSAGWQKGKTRSIRDLKGRTPAEIRRAQEKWAREYKETVLVQPYKSEKTTKAGRVTKERFKPVFEEEEG